MKRTLVLLGFLVNIVAVAQPVVVKQPVFRKDSFYITKFGAKNDGIFMNTNAINTAINECSKKGGGVVVIPAGLWLFAQHKPGLGIFMLLWGLLGISSVDNFLRPFLISQGSKMPFILIFCGVIGGALAFGLVGLFLGPTLLAVAFRLIEEWSSNPAEPEPGLIVEASSGLRGGLVSDTQLHGGESLGVR